MSSKVLAVGAVVGVSVVFLAGCSAPPESGDSGTGNTVTLTMETWRTEDAAIWNDKILPVFEKEHPGISIKFNPTNNNEYGSAISTKLQGGTAGDLITQVPYGSTMTEIQAGQIASIKGLDGLDNFAPSALEPWSSDGTPYCVPMASVGAAYYYNKKIFEELNLKVPETHDEFMKVLEAIKTNGKYTPLAFGGASADSWALDQMGFESVGPNYWQGDAGREGIEKGTMKVTDPQFIAAFNVLDSWKPYLPKGFASVTYSDATQLFALGKAAIYPDGSWDINEVSKNGLDVGVFAPPVENAGDQRFTQVLPDHALCLNSASKHASEAKTFLQWLTTDEFAQIYADEIPGFFPLSNSAVTLKSELGQQWFDLRKGGAKVTTPIGLAMVSGSSSWQAVVGGALNQMMTGDSLSPEQAAAQVQQSIEEWYAPQKK